MPSDARATRRSTPAIARGAGCCPAAKRSWTPGRAGLLAAIAAIAAAGTGRADYGWARSRRWRTRWRRWAKPKRILLTLLALVAGWLVLSLVLFLISSHFERTVPALECRRACSTRLATR